MTKRVFMLIAVLAFAMPSAAEVFPVDPTQPPTVTLPSEEAARLRDLQSPMFVQLFGEVSPDDRVLCLLDPTRGLVFRDIRTGAVTQISFDIFQYDIWSTDLRWRDAQTMVAVVSASDGSSLLLSIDRSTGAVTAQPLALPGYPFSLSPSGRKVLLARGVLTGDARAPGQGPVAKVRPLKTVPLRPAFVKRPGPALFEAEEMTVQVATVEIELAVYDLSTGEEAVLSRVPLDTAIGSIEWSRDDERLALIRSKFPDNTRGGVVPNDDPSVLDGLGRLPQAENPFFTSNALDLFRLSGREAHHVEIRPCPGEQETLRSASWNPDGRTILVQIWRASQPEGREHPSFGNGSESRFRIYSADGRLMRKLARPQISSIGLSAYFISSHEVVFVAPWQLSYGFYHFDLRTSRLHRLPTPEGAIHQARPTHHSREMVFSFSSYQDPWEVYRLGVGEPAPTQLTEINAAVKAANQIRVDAVSFRLANGALRKGRLLQPKDAAKRPRGVPMVVWQEGGPTAAMTPYWGSSVEAPFALLPNFGISVLVVPLPGRINFGPASLERLADGTHFGQVDIAEGAEIAQQLVARGYTAHDRLGISGCSYGGYFTSQSITSYPDVYAAANTQCTLLNLVDEWKTGYKPYIGYLEGRSLDDDPAEWELDSPLFQAAQVKAPTLIFAGRNDFLPWQFSQQFHDDINAAGTKADFYVFEREGHGLGWSTSQFVAAQAQIEWFRKYLNSD